VKKTSTRQKLSGNKIKEIKTFTYFIPGPPHRKNGYREKEFDKIMQGILQSGFELIDLQTQGTENGMFVLVVLKVPSKKVGKIDENLDMQDRFKLRDSHSSPEIELDAEDA
jgi:hypothetical protein